MGALGAALIAPGSGVLTHCNTGSLATAGFGTALGVIRAGVAEAAHRQGLRRRNPALAAGRAPDRVGTAAGRHPGHADRRCGRRAPDEDRRRAVADRRRRPHLRQRRHRQQDRHLRARHLRPPPRREGDGGGAVLDRGHGHAGWRRTSTSRSATATNCCPCRHPHRRRGGLAFNPVFDVTPAELIDALVTERGVIERPDAAKMAAVFGPLSRP